MKVPSKVQYLRSRYIYKNEGKCIYIGYKVSPSSVVTSTTAGLINTFVSITFVKVLMKRKNLDCFWSTIPGAFYILQVEVKKILRSDK